MEGVEKLGLVKMDFLGLSTLSIIEEALVETIGCSGMTHSAAMASEILPGKTLLEALNTDLVCDAINTAMRELFLQIVYERTQSAFSEGGLMIGAGLVYGRLFRQPYGDMSILYNEWTETTYHYDINGSVLDSTTLLKADGFCPDTSDLSFLKNDLAIALELRFRIWKGLNFSLRYQRSIIPVKKDWQFTEGHNTTHIDRWTNNCYNSSVMVRLIWQFGLDDDPTNQSRRRDRR